MVPLVALLVTGLPADNAGWWSISKAEIEDCEVNEYGLDCEQKAVTTFPVTFGAGMEKILEFRPAASDEKSLVSITVDLESVKVIKPESTGAIIEA